MDYYNYINQRQSSINGRQSSAPDFGTTGGGGDTGDGSRYSCASLLQGHCGAESLARFTGSQRHIGAPRLDRSAMENGRELAAAAGRLQDSVLGYGQAFAASSGADALRYGIGVTHMAAAASATVNSHHQQRAGGETITTSSSSSLSSQPPQRLRYMLPPPGTVLSPPLDDDDDDDPAADADAVADEAAEDNDDDDDDGMTSHGDGRSSADSARSSTSDSRNVPAAEAAPGDVHTQEMKTDAKDSSTAVKSDKSSVNTAATATGATSPQPLIYPWMRRVHSTNNGMYQHPYRKRFFKPYHIYFMISVMIYDTAQYYRGRGMWAIYTECAADHAGW